MAGSADCSDEKGRLWLVTKAKKCVSCVSLDEFHEDGGLKIVPKCCDFFSFFVAKPSQNQLSH
jgi:hypothetical protein